MVKTIEWDVKKKKNRIHVQCFVLLNNNYHIFKIKFILPDKSNVLTNIYLYIVFKN